jgi:hypothetical protein
MFSFPFFSLPTKDNYPSGRKNSGKKYSFDLYGKFLFKVVYKLSIMRLRVEYQIGGWEKTLAGSWAPPKSAGMKFVLRDDPVDCMNQEVLCHKIPFWNHSGIGSYKIVRTPKTGIC